MKSHIISYYNYMDMPFEEVTETVEKEDMDSELSTDIETVLRMHKSYTAAMLLSVSACGNEGGSAGSSDSGTSAP